MKKSLLIACILALVVSASANNPARANKNAARQAAWSPWHGPHYHPLSGRPLPLIMPPTANMYTQHNWGVAMNELRPIHHQFARPYPGKTQPGPNGMQPTPHQPSSTRQQGIYYIRGPW